MTAYEYIKFIPYLPASKEGNKIGRPSNAEIRRWLEKGSVIINGTTPKPYDKIKFPIIELIFFPSSNLKVTIILDKGW